METILEYDYIDNFLESINIKDKEYSISELNEILGEETNPFVQIDEEIKCINYSDIYNYISSIKQHKSLITQIINQNNISQNVDFKYQTSKFLVLSLSIFLWLIYFFFTESNYYVKCAKGFGLNLRIWSMLSVTLMCRTLLYGKVEKHTKYHIFIGYILFICAIGHTFFHLLNNNSVSTNNSKLNRYPNDRHDLTFITGYVLFFLSIIITLSSYFRHKGYQLFSMLHRLTYLWLPLCIVHVTPLWQWFTVPICLLGIESIINFIYKTQISTLTNSRLMSPFNLKYKNKTMFLSVPKNHATISGSYYRIMVPSIITYYKFKLLNFEFNIPCFFEWHSFSLANSEFVNQLLFLIDVRGDWTNELYEKLKLGSNSYVFVMGPFTTPSTEVLNTDTKKQLCIAGGIGIAPFISIFDTKIQKYKCNLEYRENYLKVFGNNLQQKQSISLTNLINNRSLSTPIRQPLKFIWIFRNPEQYSHLFDYIKCIFSESVDVFLDIYITGSFKDKEKIKAIFYVLNLLDNCNENIKVYFERPNLTSLIINESYTPENIFFCGSDKMEEELKTICKKGGITLKTEKFD